MVAKSCEAGFGGTGFLGLASGSISILPPFSIMESTVRERPGANGVSQSQQMNDQFSESSGLRLVRGSISSPHVGQA